MLTKYAITFAPYAMPIMAVLGLLVALATSDSQAFACSAGSGSGGGC